MKLTYAQKVEIAQKAVKVCGSVKRSNQTDIASIYADKAISVISDCDINKDIYASKANMNQRIADKPHYKYNHSTSAWVRSLTLDERLEAQKDKEINRFLGYKNPVNAAEGLIGMPISGFGAWCENVTAEGKRASLDAYNQQMLSEFGNMDLIKGNPCHQTAKYNQLYQVTEPY